MKKYYVVHTKANQEKKAMFNLEAQGFNVWIPCFNSGVVKKKTQNKTFLFPGYIFVLIDLLEDNWIKINSTYGVKYLITSNGLPKEVSLSNISLIKKVINGKLLNINDTVKVLSGKLTNKKGKIVEMCSRDRVRLLLESLSGKITTILYKKELYKV